MSNSCARTELDIGDVALATPIVMSCRSCGCHPKRCAVARGTKQCVDPEPTRVAIVWLATFTANYMVLPVVTLVMVWRETSISLETASGSDC
jgi:hypothetical protein